MCEFSNFSGPREANLKIKTVLIAFTVPALLGGCASMFSGTTQNISVETVMAGKAAPGAGCTVSNSKDSVTLTSPGTASVSKAYGDLTVKCEKDGIYSIKPLSSRFNALALLGIPLYVFPIFIDMVAGGAWQYPSNVQVDLTQPSSAQTGAASKADK